MNISTLGRLLTLAALLTVGLDTAAQLVSLIEVDQYRGMHLKHVKSWKLAPTLVDSVTIENGGLTWTQVVEAPGRSRDDLYNDLNKLFTTTFNEDVHASVKLSDREAGKIVAQAFFQLYEVQIGGLFIVFSTRFCSVQPMITCDIKEGRARVRIDIPHYISSEGNSKTTRSLQTYPIESLFPFSDRKSVDDIDICLSFVRMYCYAKVMLGKLERVVKGGAAPREESDDW